MIRRQKTISLYELLNGLIDFNFSDPNFLGVYTLHINDDRVVINDDDFDRMIQIIELFFANRQKVVVHNVLLDTYEKLIDSAKLYNVTDISVVNVRNKNNDNIYTLDFIDEFVPVSIAVMGEETFNLEYSKLNTIRNNVNYDRNVLSDKDFAKGLDSIISQINHYANNDIQKVLLLDKMLRENVIYDNEYYLSQDLTNLEKRIHKSHKAQTVLRDRVAVCDAFSNFAAFVLNKVGIECQVVYGDYMGSGHAWNSVKINNNWYYCDFTFSITGDKYHYLNYLLVDKPTLRHSLKPLNTMDRDIVKKEVENTKNIKVLMPSYYKKNGESYHVRRPAILIEEFYVPFTTDTNRDRERRTATIVEEPALKRVRRKAVIKDKKD